MISLCVYIYLISSAFAFARCIGKEEDLRVCRSEGQFLLTEASILLQEHFTPICIRKNNGKMLSLSPKVFPRLPWG